MPSFSIEAPGEANPLTEGTLLHALQAASSASPHQIQSGTKQLQGWEKSDGFYKHLQSVFVARNLPTEVRYLAIIQLKNGIDKYWRKTATKQVDGHVRVRDLILTTFSAVSKEDKAVIRSRLIPSGLEETDHRLALQNALVVAKIVRFEYPNDWPDAIFTILDAIRKSPQDTQRAQLMLLHVIKELSTARIQRSRTSLRAATPEILGVVVPLYVDRISRWQNALQGHGSFDMGTMQESLLTIKTLRRLVIAGTDFPNRDDEIRKFWQLTMSHVDSLINLESSLAGQATSSEASALVQKHLLQFSKFHLAMAETHAAGFVLLPSSLDLVRAYWGFARRHAETYTAQSSINGAPVNGQKDDDDELAEKLSVNALLLIRATIRMAYMPVSTFRYRHEQEKEEKKQAEASVKADLLNQAFTEDVLSTIITRLLVLRPKDLAAWREDPEDWVFQSEQESADLRLSVRACSERVLLDLCTHFKDNLTKPMLELFRSVADVNNEDILFKDAVYTAVGIAAPMLRDDLDFDQVLSSTLAPEVQKSKEGFNILRRRTAILVGQWIVVKVSDESRPLIYQMFNHLLREDDPINDEVVRMTAGLQFKNVADDFDFRPVDFAPYAESIISRLMKLIEEVSETGTKMSLLETISVLIERFEHRISPFAERIVQMLPSLWEESGQENLMKQSILTLLARLVNALKTDSSRYHNMLIPIVQSIIQPESEFSTSLLEEALDLWHAIVIQTVAPISPELLSLTQDYFPLLDTASETLRETLQIIESYILLAPSEILSDAIRKPILSSFTALIGPKSKPDANGMVCVAIELLIRLATGLGGEAAAKQLTSDLVESGFMGRILSGLRSAWTAHCTTGPLAKIPTVDGMVETDYFAVLSRVALASNEGFLQAVLYTPLPTLADDGDGDMVTAQAPLEDDDRMKWLLEEWFAHLDNISDPARRKLMCLALTSLLDSPDPTPLLKDLQLLMGLWTSVILELGATEEIPGSDEQGPIVDKEGDTLVYTRIEDLRVVAEDSVEAPEDVRRREAAWADVVHRVGVPGWVRGKLGALIARVGQEGLQQWLGDVDGDVVAGFGRLGIM